jgi:hypothetical protein
MDNEVNNDQFGKKMASFLREEIPRKLLDTKNEQTSYKGALFVLTESEASAHTFHWIGLTADMFQEYEKIAKREITEVDSRDKSDYRRHSDIVATIGVCGKILILVGLKESLGLDILRTTAVNSKLLTARESRKKKSYFDLIAV